MSIDEKVGIGTLGKMIIYPLTLAMIVLGADKARADSITHIYDDHYQHKATIEKHDAPEPYDAHKDLRVYTAKDLDALLELGWKTLKEGDNREADRIFQYANTLPGHPLEANIGQTIAWYNVIEQKEGKDSAKEKALYMVNAFLEEKPGNVVLENYKANIQRGVSPDKINLEAHKICAQAIEAEKHGNTQKAYELMEKAVGMAFDDYELWNNYAGIVGRTTKGNEKDKNLESLKIWKKGLIKNKGSPVFKNTYDVLNNYCKKL